MHTFISYSAHDAVIANHIRAGLERCGVRCWKAPEDIRPGESWPRAIARALGESVVMLLLCSKHSAASPEVSKELNIAMNSKMRVIPIRIEPVDLNGDWAYHLSNIQWFDLGATNLASLVHQVAAIVAQVASSASQPPVPADLAVAVAAQQASPLAQAYIAGYLESVDTIASVFTRLRLGHANGTRASGVTTGPAKLEMLLRAKKLEQFGGVGIETFLVKTGRWVIAGAPGSGKSTMLRMIASDAAERWRNNTAGTPFPLFIELGRYQPGNLANLDILLDSFTTYTRQAVTHEMIADLLGASGFLWVLDGLDEGMIGSANPNDTPLWHELEQLVQRYPGHSFLVSTRLSHVPKGNRFETLLIRPLEGDEPRLFIARYLAGFSSSASADEVVAAVPSALRDVANTPLLLSMIVFLWVQQATLPSSVEELYRTYVAHCLHEVEASRATRYQPYVKDMALAALAFEMLTTSVPSLKSSDAIAVVGRRLQQLAERGESAGDARSTDLLNELSYSGLLVREEYRVSFAHLTLMEHFASCEMRREYNFSAQAAMDQYFLRNIEKIRTVMSAAAITPADRVIEVGAGIGSIARHLPPALSVTLVDLDPDLTKILRFQFPGYEVMEGDALQVLAARPFDVLLSNLPFFLTQGILEILTAKQFKRAIMSVRAEDTFEEFQEKLQIRQLTILDEDDFFPRQPFKSKLILIEPRPS